jgi:hypothetical protein
MVIDFNGCKGMDSVSLQYKTDCPRSIYFPKALIPNGDSLNDQFARVVYGIIINLKFITGGERLYFTGILQTRDGMVTTRYIATKCSISMEVRRMATYLVKWLPGTKPSLTILKMQFWKLS